MRAILSRQREAGKTVLVNTSFLIGDRVVRACLGFVYWWLAARLFPPAAVGLASAAVSAMTLLGTVGVSGLGDFVIGQVSQVPDRAPSLVTTTLVVTGVVSLWVGVVFAIVASRLSVEFGPLGERLGGIALFASGVMVNSVAWLLDDALIGLLHGALEFSRIVLFSVGKLAALIVAGIWLSDPPGMAIYAAWLVGNLVSLAILVGVVAFRGVRMARFWPDWGLLRELKHVALGHQALSLALEGPALVLPIMVTLLLSAELNAGFYASLMIASIASLVPTVSTSVLYAAGSPIRAVLTRNLRLTLGLSVVGGVLANLVLLPGAGQVLSLFGREYADQAAWSLRILALGAFPLIIRTHYVAICRIQGRVAGAARRMAAGGLLELALAAIGGSIGGLTGLSLGWVLAVCVEAAFAARVVYDLALPAKAQTV